MSFLFDDTYYKVGKNGVSPFQNMHFHLCPIETRVGERRYVHRCAYLGGSAIQTVGDNPVTAYRQLVQQYARPPRPSGMYRQGHRLADALPRGTDLHHEPVQAAQPEEARTVGRR